VRGLANRQLGSIERVNRDAVTIRLDTGGQVTIPAHERQHFDYGYALTSYSSQAQTVGRVLLNIDVDLGDTLVNDRLAYVGPSRAREDVQIFTNDKSDLVRVLSRALERPSALDLDDTREHASHTALRITTPTDQQQQPTHGDL
jgi:ATP-dependent exoDNAse (exonuclease V) alpha subunit